MKIFNNTPEKIILLLSGGLDSASLFYLLCKYYPNTEIIPATGVVKQGLKDAECARNIVMEMRKRFTNIGNHYEYDVDLENPYWIKKSEEQFKNSTHNSGSPVGLSKHMQQVEGLKKVREKTGAFIFVNATTRNPPEHLNFNISEADRSPNIFRKKVIKTPYGAEMHSPYINKDKKFVASIYKKEKLDWLYYLTRSCVASAEETNNFKIECGKCYWCQEKSWAFDYI